MIQIGLSSDALPGSVPEEVIHFAADAGLKVLEWHSAHVPADNLDLARAARNAMARRGMKTSAYVPDWHLGDRSFATVLNAAVILEARSVRIGGRPSPEIGRTEREGLERELRNACGLARRAGIEIVVEIRPDTFVDSHRARLGLLRRLGHLNLRADWRPSAVQSHEDRLDDLSEILSFLTDVRLSPTISRSDWSDYLRLAARRKRFAILGGAWVGDVDFPSQVSFIRELVSGSPQAHRSSAELRPRSA